ncbi:MAG: hypothetical protein R8M38_10280, partial [Mariprofundaceae bacterium]
MKLLNIIFLTLFLAACSGNEQISSVTITDDSGTTPVTITFGATDQGEDLASRAVTNTLPTSITSISVEAFDANGVSIAGPATSSLAPFAITLTVPNGSGITLKVMAYDVNGVLIYQGSTIPQTLSGTAVTLSIHMDMAIAIASNPSLTTVSAGTVFLFSGTIAGQTPTTTSPLIWSATDALGNQVGAINGAIAGSINGSQAGWSAPFVAGTYTITTKVDPAANPDQSTTTVATLVITVTVPANTTKTWNGSIDALWSTPANWTPAGIPTGVDNVLIPSAPMIQPILAAIQSVGGINVEAGAILDIGGFALTVSGNIVSDGSITALSGGVIASGGPGSTISGNLPLVTIAGSYVANGPITMATLGTNSTGTCVFDIGGQNVTISGNMFINNSATFAGSALIMNNSASVLKVGGNATFSKATILTAGTLFISGNITASTTVATAFAASGTHNTILNGTTVQNIDLPIVGGAAAGSQGFQSLQIDNPAGITVTNQTYVDGNLDIIGTAAVNLPSVGFSVKGDFTQEATTSFSGASIRFGGTLNFAAGATFNGVSLVLDNATVSPQIIPPSSANITYGNLLIEGAAKLSGATTITTRLDMGLTGAGTLDLNGFNLAITGSLLTQAGTNSTFLGTGETVTANNVISISGLTFDNVTLKVAGPTTQAPFATKLDNLTFQNYLPTVTPLQVNSSNWTGTINNLNYYSTLNQPGYHIGGTGTGNTITVASTNIVGTTDPTFTALTNTVTWPAPTIPIGTTHVWTGASNTSWGIAGNWDVGSIPGATSIVFIPSAPANQPAINNPRSISGFANEPFSTLTLNWSLTVANAFTNIGTIDFGIQNLTKQLTIAAGSLTNTGTIMNSGGGGATITGAVINNGIITVNAPLTISGLLSGFSSQTINGNGSTLTAAGGVSVVNMTVDNTILEINVNPTTFQNITFQNYASTATPLLLGFVGSTASFTNVLFNSPLTTGKHIGGLGTGNTITINGTNIILGSELVAVGMAGQITWIGQQASGIVSTLIAGLSGPWGLSIDNAGNAVVADPLGQIIQKVTPAGTMTGIAGNTTWGFSGDGGLATAANVGSPHGTAIDAVGNVYIADSNNDRIRKVDVATGKIQTIAGDGTPSFGGDSGDARLAQLNNPWDLALSGGFLFVTELQNHAIRSIDLATNIITTVYGSPVAGLLNAPNSMAVDGSGSLLVGDNFNCRVVKIMTPTTTPTATVVAGSGTCGWGADGRQATVTAINNVTSVAVDSANNIYIVHAQNHLIRMVSGTNGTMSTLAGSGVPGYTGDGGLAATATFNTPSGIAIDSSGNILVSDYGNGAIRKFATPSASAGIAPVAAVAANPGIFWESATTGGLGGGNILRDIASNGTLFVTVGDTGMVATSSTGANGSWLGGTTGIANNLQGITWGNGKFVAVGAGQTIITSTDGINWVAVTGV